MRHKYFMIIKCIGFDYVFLCWGRLGEGLGGIVSPEILGKIVYTRI